jgi:hypothetical protein
LGCKERAGPIFGMQKPPAAGAARAGGMWFSSGGQRAGGSHFCGLVTFSPA